MLELRSPCSPDMDAKRTLTSRATQTHPETRNSIRDTINPSLAFLSSSHCGLLTWLSIPSPSANGGLRNPHSKTTL